MTTLEEVEAHNAKYDVGLSTYKQGINFYSDWTWDEFKNTVLMREIVDAQLVNNLKFLMIIFDIVYSLKTFTS